VQFFKKAKKNIETITEVILVGKKG